MTQGFHVRLQVITNLYRPFWALVYWWLKCIDTVARKTLKHQVPTMVRINVLK